MAAELAKAVAGCAGDILHYGCYVPFSGDVGILGDFVQKSLVSSCGTRMVECRIHI